MFNKRDRMHRMHGRRNENCMLFVFLSLTSFDFHFCHIRSLHSLVWNGAMNLRKRRSEFETKNETDFTEEEKKKQQKHVSGGYLSWLSDLLLLLLLFFILSQFLRSLVRFLFRFIFAMPFNLPKKNRHFFFSSSAFCKCSFLFLFFFA